MNQNSVSEKSEEGSVLWFVFFIAFCLAFMTFFMIAQNADQKSTSMYFLDSESASPWKILSFASLILGLVSGIFIHKPREKPTTGGIGIIIVNVSIIVVLYWPKIFLWPIFF